MLCVRRSAGAGGAGFVADAPKNKTRSRLLPPPSCCAACLCCVYPGCVHHGRCHHVPHAVPDDSKYHRCPMRAIIPLVQGC